MISTATAAIASVKAIEALRAGDWDVAAIQDYLEQAGGRPRPVVVSRAPART
jgi:hypothetical protein